MTQGKDLKQCLKPLSVLSSLVGLGCYGKPSNFKKSFIFIIFIFYILNFIHSFTELERYRNIVSTVEGEFVHLILSLGCMASMISTNFSRSKQFLKALEYFDGNIGLKVPRREVLLWFVMILHRLEMSTFILCGIYELFELKIYDWQYFTGLYIGQFQLDVARFAIYWLSTEFCLRFKILKHHLENSFNVKEELNITGPYLIFIHNRCDLKIVKKISNLHNMLCDDLDLMNGIYGLTMLFDVLTCISFMVEFFTVMIKVFVIEKHEDDMWFFALWCSEYSVSMFSHFLI